MKKIVVILLVMGVFFVTNTFASEQLPSDMNEKIVMKTSGEASYKYGKITKIENGKDGQQIYITDSKGVEFNSAVSVHDIINDEEGFGLYLGSKVKIYYYEKIDGMNVLIGDVVDVVSDGLSKNDEDFLKVLRERDIDKNFLHKADIFLQKYETKLKKMNSDKAVKFNNKMVIKMENLISNLLLKYPQDIALPVKANTLYLKLELLKLEFIKLDFVK